MSWGLGFWLSVAANLVGLAILLLGNRFYLHEKPQGSPFMNIARVLVAAFKKRNYPLSPIPDDYYYGDKQVTNNVDGGAPKKKFQV